jgi:hypothetical protein
MIRPENLGHEILLLTLPDNCVLRWLPLITLPELAEGLVSQGGVFAESVEKTSMYSNTASRASFSF